MIIRVDASAEIGLGHLRRIQTITQTLEHLKISYKLLIKAPKNFIPQSLNSNTQLILDTIPVEEELALLNKIKQSLSTSKILLDISHKKTHQNKKSFETYCKELSRLGFKTMLFDGYKHDSIAYSTFCDVHTFIAPYVNAEHLIYKLPETCHTLLGPKYLPIPKALQEAKKTTKKAATHTALISISGTDPHKITEAVIKKISTLTQIQFNVPLPKSFDPHYTNQLLELLQVHTHITCYPNPENFFQMLREATFIITGGGMTKYEAAYLETPQIILTHSASENEINTDFAKAGTALHLLNNVDALPSALSQLTHIQTCTKKCEHLIPENSTLNLVKKLLN